MFEWLLDCICGTKEASMRSAIDDLSTSVRSLRKLELEHKALITASENAITRTNEEEVIAREKHNILLSQREIELIGTSITILTEEILSIRTSQRAMPFLSGLRSSRSAKKRCYR